MPSNTGKVLILDIETRPTTAYVWRTFKENISPDQVIEPGYMICWAAKFEGKNFVHFGSEWENGRDGMAAMLHDLMSQADAVVTYNGDKFDLPKIQGEFLLQGLPPTPPIPSIDVLKTVRKFGFLMNRLAFIGPFLGLGSKVKHEGFNLWKAVMAGDTRAQGRMKRYNIQDVNLLEKLYKRIKPYIKNHPHLGDDARECGACGSDKVQSRGYRRTKYFKIQRLQCQGCGSWQDGKREKV